MSYLIRHIDLINMADNEQEYFQRLGEILGLSSESSKQSLKNGRSSRQSLENGTILFPGIDTVPVLLSTYRSRKMEWRERGFRTPALAVAELPLQLAQVQTPNRTEVLCIPVSSFQHTSSIKPHAISIWVSRPYQVHLCWLSFFRNKTCFAPG